MSLARACLALWLGSLMLGCGPRTSHISRGFVDTCGTQLAGLEPEYVIEGDEAVERYESRDIAAADGLPAMTVKQVGDGWSCTLGERVAIDPVTFIEDVIARWPAIYAGRAITKSPEARRMDGITGITYQVMFDDLGSNLVVEYDGARKGTSSVRFTYLGPPGQAPTEYWKEMRARESFRATEAEYRRVYAEVIEERQSSFDGQYEKMASQLAKIRRQETAAWEKEQARRREREVRAEMQRNINAAGGVSGGGSSTGVGGSSSTGAGGSSSTGTAGSSGTGTESRKSYNSDLTCVTLWGECRVKCGVGSGFTECDSLSGTKQTSCWNRVSGERGRCSHSCVQENPKCRDRKVVPGQGSER